MAVKRMTIKKALNDRKKELQMINDDISKASSVSISTVINVFAVSNKQDIRFRTLLDILRAMQLKLFIVSNDGKFIREIVKEAKENED